MGFLEEFKKGYQRGTEIASPTFTPSQDKPSTSGGSSRAGASTNTTSSTSGASSYSSPKVTTKAPEQTVKAPSASYDTSRGLLAAIGSLYKTDKNAANELFTGLQSAWGDYNSSYSRPFDNVTNKSKAVLDELGIDTSNINQQWYDTMNPYLNYLERAKTSNNFSTPTKRQLRDPNIRIGQAVQQYIDAEGFTVQAETEYAQMLKDIEYLANDPRNFSPQEIVRRLDVAKNYKALAKMDESRMGHEPVELNRVVRYNGEDDLYTLIYQARNGSSGYYIRDMTDAGYGGWWQEDQELKAKYDRNRYSVGMVDMDDAGRYFGQYSFDWDWYNQNYDESNTDPEYVRMMQKVNTALTNYDNANAEIAELNKYLERKLKSVKSDKDVENALKGIDWSDYPTLLAIDKSLGKDGHKGNFKWVPTAGSIDYCYQDIVDRLNAAKEENSSKLNGDDTIDSFNPPDREEQPTNVSLDTTGEDQGYKYKAPDWDQEVVIPSVIDGKKVSEKEAIEHYKNTGELLNGPENADEPLNPQVVGASPEAQPVLSEEAVARQEEIRKEAQALASREAFASGEANYESIQDEELLRNAYDSKHGEGSYDQAMTDAASAGAEEAAAPESTGTKGKFSAADLPIIASSTPGVKPTQGARTKAAKTGTQLTEETLNAKVKDAVNALEGSMTDGERMHFENIPGVEYGRVVLEMKKGPLNPALWQDEWFKEYNCRKSEESANKTYINTAIGSMEIRHNYERTEKDLKDMQDVVDKNWEKYGDQVYAVEDVPEEMHITLSNGMDVAFELNHATKTYEEVVDPLIGDLEERLSRPTGPADYYNPDDYDVNKYRAEIEQKLQSATEYANKVLSTKEKYGEEKPEGMLTLAEMQEVQDQIVRAQQWLVDNQGDYNRALFDLTDARNHQSSIGEMMLRNGFDIVDPRYIDGMLDAAESFLDWQTPQETGTNLLNELWSKPISDEECLATIQQIDETLKEDGTIQDYFGDLPDSFNSQIDSHKAYLEKNKRMYQYYQFSQSKRFHEYAEKGRDIAARYLEENYDGEGRPTGIGSTKMGFLQMSSDEQELYYALLGYQGIDVADKYYEDIDASLFARTEETAGAIAEEKAQSGALGRLENIFWAGLMGPVEAFNSAMNLVTTAVTGKGNKWMRAPTKISQRIYSETQKEVENVYKDDEAKKWFVSKFYDAAYNNWRSATTSLVFSPFVPAGAPEGTSAIAIAMVAGDEAYQDAVDRDMEPWKAATIGAVNFFSEWLTEGIKIKWLDKLAEGGSVTDSSVKQFVRGLVPEYVKEVLGEEGNLFFEKAADILVGGDKGETAERLDYYKNTLHYSDKEAEDMITSDLMAEAWNTAFTTAFSTLLGGVGAAYGQLKTYGHYAKVAASDRISGRNPKATVRSVMNGDIAIIRSEEQARQAWENREPGKFNFGEQKVNGPDITDSGFSEAGKQANMDQYDIELNVLEGVSNSTPEAQTETLGAVLEVDDADSNRAGAAASLLRSIFGDKTVDKVQQLLAGGLTGNININILKKGIQMAAMADGRCRNIMTSDAFQRADPETQARWLAEAVAEDAQNQNVQNQVNDATHEFRVNEEEKRLMSEGAGDAAVAAKENIQAAKEETEAARDELEKRSDDVEAKQEAAKVAGEEAANNPTDENVNEAVKTTEELKKSVESEDQYQQHLDKTERQEKETTAKEQRTIDETAASIRQQAETTVRQQEQAEAQAAAEAAVKAQEEQARQREEQRQQLIADQRSGKLQEESDEAKLRRLAEERGYTGEQAEKFIKDVLDFAKNQRLGKIDMSKQFSKSDGWLMMGALSRRFGVNVRITELEGNDNGFFDPDTNTITLNSKLPAGQILVEFALHELTHSLEKTGAYKDYYNAVLGIQYKSEAELNKAIADMIAAREEAGHPIDKAQAKRELVAEFTRLKLHDKDMVQRMVDAGLGGRMRNALHNINQFLKNLKLKGQDRITAENLRRAERMFQKAIDQKAKQQQQALQTETQQANTPEAKLNREATPIAQTRDGSPLASEVRNGTISKSDSDVEYSTASWTEEEKTRVLKELTATGEYTEEQAKKWIEDVNSVAAIILADQNRLDYDVTDPNKRMLKPNQDYYFTVDASTLCAKRLLYQGTFDAIQAQLPNTPLMPEDLIDLANMMREAGYETPCGICYVESRRRWLGKYAQEWLDSYEGEYKPTLKQVTTSDGLEELRNSHPETYKAFTEAMKAKGSANPKVVQLRTDYRGDISQMTPSEVQKVKDIGGLRIQSFSDFEVPHLIDMMQAVLDMASKKLTSQAYTKVPEFARVFGGTGIKINLSLIGKGTGLDANGNLIFDNVEGMNFDEAMRIRDMYSDNVGTILVGMNDDHIIAAMGDNRIDFIIPFHKSGWSQEELNKMPVLNSYSDYTDSQNERIITGKKTITAKKDVGQKAVDNWIAKEGENHPNYKVTKGENGKFTITYEDGYETESFQKHKERTGESKSNFEPVGANKYWEFDKDGEYNANKYLEMCKQDHRVPKFSQFLVDNGDGSFSLPQGDDARSQAIRKGYWKTLIDFKMYNNDGVGADQKAVTPNVNMDEAQDVLNNYSLTKKMPGGQTVTRADNNTLPVAQDIVDAYVQKYKDEHPGREYSAGTAEMTDAQKREILSQAYTDYQSAVGRGDMEAAQEDVDFVANEKGYTIHAYHGTGRGDRVGNVFLPERATSGPMAFFTDNRGIAENYARDKKDTSIEYDEEYGDYFTQFRGTNKKGKSIPIGDLWNEMSYRQRQQITEAGKHITEDDDGNIIYDPAAKNGNGGFDSYRLRDNNGNAINALIDVWLQDGTLYGEEGRFLDVLRLAGIDNATWNDPDARHEKVYNTWLKIQKPFNTAEQYTQEFLDGLEAWWAEQDQDKYSRETNNSDFWDKNNWTLERWVERARDDVASGTSHMWTSIPDFVTDYLKSMGYDGIQDVGGKNGGETHTVWIPFSSEQVKSAEPVTYDDRGIEIPLEERFTDSKDIRYSTGISDLTDAQKAEIMKEVGLDTSADERINRQIGQQESVIDRLPEWDDGSEKTVAEVREFLGGEIYYALDQWMHNTFQKGPRQSQKITKDDIISFIQTDRQRILDGAKSLIDGWSEILYDYSGKSIEHNLDENNNNRPTNYEPGISRTRSVANVVFSSDLNIYNGPESKENRGDFINTDTGAIIRMDNKTINETISRSDRNKYNRNAVVRILMNADELIRDAIYVGSHVDYAEVASGANVHYLVAQATAGGNSNAVIFAVHDPSQPGTGYSEKAYVVEMAVIPEKNEGAPGDDAVAESATNIDLIRQTPSNTSIGSLLQTVNTDRIRFFDKGALSDSEYEWSSGSTELTDANRMQALIDAGIITAEDQQSRPLEGQNQVLTSAAPGAQRQFGQGMLQDSDEIGAAAKRYVLSQNSYIPDTNPQQIDRAINWIRGNKNNPTSDGLYESIDQIVNGNFDYRSADGQARMVAAMGLAVAKGDTFAQITLADAFNRQGTDLGRALQARKLFRLMTPEGRIGALRKMLQNQQDILDAKGINQDLKFSEWIYMAAAAATEDGDFQKVQEAAAEELSEQLPASWKDKLRAWRMLSMLGNPRTHIRNIVGNALFIPAVSIKNKLGAVAELGMKQGNRTKTLNPFLSKEVRDFARQDAIAMKDELTGEAKYKENPKVQAEPFHGLLKVLSDFNSNRLEGEDWFFLKGHYRRALGGWIQANGYTIEQLQSNPELLEQGRAYAINEAQKATYRDFNGLAAKLNELTRNPKTTGQKALAFGVEAVLPFKKTPANILKRGLEYSPVGIARSLTTDIYHLKQYLDYQKGKLKAMPEKAISPNQFIDRICSGLTGSGILMMGAFLANMGVVSCGLGDDDDEFEKIKGNQKYAIKFNLLGQDVTFTMDWAAPMSMPFFVGAAIQNMSKDEKGFSIDALVNAFGNITEPVFNLSMLDGVNSLLQVSQSEDSSLTQIGAKILTNYATSYIPSFVGAVARTYDDTSRKAYVESGKGSGVMGTLRYAYEQTQNKIPGWSQTNIPVRDVWGNAKKSGLAERILENFVLPGYIEQYKEDPVTNAMATLFEQTGSPDVVPKDPAKTFSAGGQKYVLTAEQWDTYKTVRGQNAYDGLNALIQTDEYQNSSDDAKVEMVKAVWDYANQKGKLAVDPANKEQRVTVNYAEMTKALDAGDYEAYETMVEALHQDGIEDSSIRTKIGNKYRDQYKDAYRNGNYERMYEIEDILDASGFSFKTSDWEKAVDKEQD